MNIPCQYVTVTDLQISHELHTVVVLFFLLLFFSCFVSEDLFETLFGAHLVKNGGGHRLQKLSTNDFCLVNYLHVQPAYLLCYERQVDGDLQTPTESFSN